MDSARNGFPTVWPQRNVSLLLSLLQIFISPVNRADHTHFLRLLLDYYNSSYENIRWSAEGDFIHSLWYKLWFSLSGSINRLEELVSGSHEQEWQLCHQLAGSWTWTLSLNCDLGKIAAQRLSSLTYEIGIIISKDRTYQYWGRVSCYRHCHRT